MKSVRRIAFEVTKEKIPNKNKPKTTDKPKK